MALGNIHLNNTGYSDPLKLDISPAVCVFFNVLHQYLILFSIQIFLSSWLNLYLYIFLFSCILIIRFISFSDGFLSLYKNTVNFCMLSFILHYYIIYYFWWRPKFSVYKIMSYANTVNFILYFWFGHILFIFISLLLCLGIPVSCWI